MTIYDTVYNLADLSFVGGTDKELTFTVYQEDGVNLCDITAGSAIWNLCRFGDFSQSVLEIAGTITDANHFTVAIPASSTLSLSGKFVQQAIVTDFEGHTFRAGQGIVLIFPAIPTA